MFLLVSGRHVGAHLDGHTNRYKFEENVSPHIFDKKNCCDLIMNFGEGLCICTFFLQPWSKHLGTVMKIKSENALLK